MSKCLQVGPETETRQQQHRRRARSYGAWAASGQSDCAAGAPITINLNGQPAHGGERFCKLDVDRITLGVASMVAKCGRGPERVLDEAVQ